MSYYGSEFADRVVKAWYRYCRRNGLQYDEPGKGGVDITGNRDGSEVVSISNRWNGIVYRCVQPKGGGRMRSRVM